MASGFAQRREKPAMFVINAYGKEEGELFWRACRWDRQRNRRNPVRATGHSRPINSSKPHVETLTCGRLDMVPLEITQMILHKLDLESLDSVRQLNTYHRAAVEQLHAYRLLKRHASHTLEVIFRTNMAKHVQLGRLFAEFVQPSCRGCGAFGPMIFLPTVQRSCQKCLQDNVKFWIINIGLLHEYLGPDLSMVRSRLPVIYCPEGRFAHPDISSHICSLPEYVSVAQAESIAPQIRDGLRRQKELACEPFPTDSDMAWWLKELCGIRGATDLPFWDPQTGKAETGVYCTACCEVYDSESYLDFDETPAYTLAEIPRHFKQCSFLHHGYVPIQWPRFPLQNTPVFWVTAKGEAEQPDPCLGNRPLAEH